MNILEQHKENEIEINMYNCNITYTNKHIVIDYNNKKYLADLEVKFLYQTMKILKFLIRIIVVLKSFLVKI